MARKPAFITHSPEREAEIQSRMLDALEARFRRRISAVLVSEAQGLLQGYLDLGYIPPPTEDHVRDIREVYREIARVSARTFGRRIVTQGKAAGFVLETKQLSDFSELFQSLANTWINLEPIRRRIQSVSETTRAQIVAIVARGQDQGLGVEAIAREIADKVPEISRWRGALIARTETHGAANFAMHETAKTTGLNLEKEWVSVEDMRTRSIARDDAFDHASMNGQRVGMDEPFMMPWVAGEPIPIMYPGQAGLPGGAVINCRCAVVHRVMGGLLGEPGETSPAAVSAVLGEPANAFAYQNYVPPRSVPEMQEFITQNNIADAADLKGLRIGALADQLVYFQEVTERFDLDPLIAVGPATRFGMRQVKGANAAIYSAKNRATGREGIFHLPIKFGDDDNFNKQRAVALRSRERFDGPRRARLERDGNLSPDVRAVVDEMDSRGDIYSWTFNAEMEPAQARRFIIYHEYGHVLHLTNTRNRAMSDDINKFIGDEKPRLSGWDLLVSRYGGTNDKEYVAETFALYMAGPQQHYRIHPRLLEIYKRYDRAAR